ncbi:MAG: copper chaperone PCu(A)C [Pseudomonadota bacterium]
MKQAHHKKILFTLGLVLLSGYSQALFAKASDDVAIEKPYVRAMPPGQPNSASFMQLHNSSATAYTLVSVKSDVAEIVELHTHIHKDGMMQMRKVEKIDIPANGSTTLKPGGLHIMLIKLNATLKVGQQVKLSLKFNDGSTKDITAPVQKIMMQGMMKMKSH